MAENPAGKRPVFYHQTIMPWPAVALLEDFGRLSTAIESRAI